MTEWQHDLERTQVLEWARNGGPARLGYTGSEPEPAPVTGSAKHPELAHLKGLAYSREYQRRARAERRAAGLTSRGTKPKYRLLVHPELAGLPRREYKRRIARIYRQRKAA